MARLASRDSAATPLFGTPAYWCPEPIMGKPQDARSDLFSLALSLRDGDRQTALRRDSLRHLRPSSLFDAAAASHANPSLPAAFDESYARCLQKNRPRVYATAEALAEDLYPWRATKSFRKRRRKTTAMVCATARLVFSLCMDTLQKDRYEALGHLGSVPRVASKKRGTTSFGRIVASKPFLNGFAKASTALPPRSGRSSASFPILASSSCTTSESTSRVLPSW